MKDKTTQSKFTVWDGQLIIKGDGNDDSAQIIAYSLKITGYNGQDERGLWAVQEDVYNVHLNFGTG